MEDKLKIDFDHWMGSEIGHKHIDLACERQVFQLIEMLKPEFDKDGDQFCFTYPSKKGLPNDCIQGFGETVFKAAMNFSQNIYNEKAIKNESRTKPDRSTA